MNNCSNEEIKVKQIDMMHESCPHNHVSASFSNAICTDCGEEIANWSRESMEPDYE